jgi:hypothetical protein
VGPELYLIEAPTFFEEIRRAEGDDGPAWQRRLRSFYEAP